MARNWLAQFREKAGLTHEEVATLAGIKRQYYSMIENGSRNPSVSVAKKIAEALGFEWTLFFDHSSNETLLSGHEATA
jgi:putative transcriptional regulator